MGEEGGSSELVMNREEEEEEVVENEEVEDSDDESCKFSEYGDIEKLADDSFLGDDVSEEYREYWKQVAMSEGFDVPSRRPKEAFGGVLRLDKSNPFYQYAEKGAEIAVAHYNEKRAPPDGKLRLVRLETVNGSAVAGMLYFLTIEAQNTVSREKNLYQTSLYWRIDKSWKVESFRKKKHPV